MTIKKGKNFQKIHPYIKQKLNKQIIDQLPPVYEKKPGKEILISGHIPVFEGQIAYYCEGCEMGCSVILHSGCANPSGMKKNPCHLLREIRNCDYEFSGVRLKAFKRYRI